MSQKHSQRMEEQAFTPPTSRWVLGLCGAKTNPGALGAKVSQPGQNEAQRGLQVETLLVVEQTNKTEPPFFRTNSRMTLVIHKDDAFSCAHMCQNIGVLF